MKKSEEKTTKNKSKKYVVTRIGWFYPEHTYLQIYDENNVNSKMIDNIYYSGLSGSSICKPGLTIWEDDDYSDIFVRYVGFNEKFVNRIGKIVSVKRVISDRIYKKITKGTAGYTEYINDKKPKHIEEKEEREDIFKSKLEYELFFEKDKEIIICNEQDIEYCREVKVMYDDRLHYSFRDILEFAEYIKNADIKELRWEGL